MEKITPRAESYLLILLGLEGSEPSLQRAVSQLSGSNGVTGTSGQPPRHPWCSDFFSQLEVVHLPGQGVKTRNPSCSSEGTGKPGKRGHSSSGQRNLFPLVHSYAACGRHNREHLLAWEAPQTKPKGTHSLSASWVTFCACSFMHWGGTEIKTLP